jgi:hypothetical protein
VGRRKIIIRESVSESIASVAWFIESKGLVKTAERFSDEVYDAIDALADNRVIHPVCKEPDRRSLGLKCVPYKRKYTIVFYESDAEIVVHEFLLSKRIHW